MSGQGEPISHEEVPEVLENESSGACPPRPRGTSHESAVFRDCFQGRVWPHWGSLSWARAGICWGDPWVSGRALASALAVWRSALVQQDLAALGDATTDCL